MNWKSTIRTIHVWIGLICGAFLCITCLSGSIAVFRPQLQAAFSPKITAADSRPQADINDAAARVLAANPEARITRVGLPTSGWNAFLFTMDSGEKKSRRIVVDAATGMIAGEENLPWLDWIIDLHHNLLFGKTGRLCVGVVGIILFLTSATGLIMSLLRQRLAWKSFVTVTTSGPRHRFYFDLHRASGLWAYAFLTLLSFTGMALGFPDAFRLVFGQRPAVAKTKPAKGQNFKSLKEYVEISRAALPNDAQVTELRLPKSAKDAISVRFRMPGDLGDAGRNELSLAAGGNVLGIRKTADDPVGVRIQSAFTPIHYGEVGGIAIRILWSLAGITPLILYVTGLLFFFRKKPQRRLEVRPVVDEILVTQRSF